MYRGRCAFLVTRSPSSPERRSCGPIHRWRHYRADVGDPASALRAGRMDRALSQGRSGAGRQVRAGNRSGEDVEAVLGALDAWLSESGTPGAVAENRTEVKTMLRERVQEWMAEKWVESRAEGRRALTLPAGRAAGSNCPPRSGLLRRRRVFAYRACAIQIVARGRASSISRGVRVPVQLSLRPARDHPQTGLRGVEDAADAGAAAQVELGLSGNQD